MVKLSDRFAPNERIAGRGLPGDYLVLNLGSGDYFGLGEVGGFIWERLDGTRDLAAVAAAVAEHFAVAEEEAAEDLLDFVRQLLERELLREVEA